jgi:hypothetical protein
MSNSFLIRVVGAACLALAAGCHSDAALTPGAALGLGESFSRAGAQTVTLDGGSAGADYIAVLVNTNPTAGVRESFTLQGSGIAAPATTIVPIGGAALARTPIEGGVPTPELDRAYEASLRLRERRELTPRFSAARAWYASRQPASSRAPTISGGASRSFDLTRRDGALPAGVKVGDIVTVNVNGTDACTNPVNHGARVAAIGTHAIILADTLNPSGGFTDSDFQRYAARFDTLVFPLDSAAFGPPTDIDGNGHVGLIFTRTVNELTPAKSSSYVGGFTFSRDLFPVTATARAEACPASNQGEYFYLLAPDPLGSINGNARTTGFVDSNTTSVIAHEFQHLINASRRLYVNNAESFEVTWLDEGLAHTAEELLFYREAGLTPKNNLDTQQIRATTQRRTAFNLDMLGNTGRYQSYLRAPSGSSPYAANDSLSTRGAAWSLLRYLADRSGASDNEFFSRLVNSTTTGLDNLKAVYASDFVAALRDWSMSHAVDDVAGTAPELQQPSWNWHSVYPALAGGYPLAVQVMAEGAPTSGTIVAGGASFFKLGVPAGGAATLNLGDPSSSAATNLQLMVVRTR